MLDVGIKETTTTTGTGTVTLSAVSNFVRVSDAFGVGDMVSYCLTSGNGDKEWGIGRAAASNTFSRDFVKSTLVGTTFTSSGASAISLTGTSTLIVTQTDTVHAGGELQIGTSIGTMYFSPAQVNLTTISTGAAVADRLYAVPFTSTFAGGISGAGIIVTTAVAGSAYVGVAESYRDSNGWRPGRLIGQTSALDLSTTGTKVDTSFTPKMKAGHIYWMLLTCSSAATIRFISTSNARNMLGFESSGQGKTYIYATQAGPIPSDLSSTSFAYATNTNIPFAFFAS